MKKLLIIGAILVILGLGGVILKYYKIKKVKQKINEVYNDYVVTIRDTNLYVKSGNKYQKIGEVKANTILNLDIKGVYMHLNDTNYYVFYKDIEKTIYTKINDPYIATRYAITTSDFSLTKDDEVLRLKESNHLDIIKEDEDYIVKFNNQYYNLKKTDATEVKGKANEEADDGIKILYYEQLYDKKVRDCSNTYCVTVDAFSEQIKLLKAKNYYFLTLEDYWLWKDRKIDVSKAVLLLFKKNDYLENLSQELSFVYNLVPSDMEFVNSNVESKHDDKEINRYAIINSMDISDFEKIINNVPLNYKQIDEIATSIPVLNYHFFYDKAKNEVCRESICLDTAKFRQQLDYLKNNGFKTLTMEEFRAWMYGEIELPKKSVLLTIDDGAMGTDTHLKALLEEYNMYGTLFLITAWWPKEKYLSPNLEIESHGHDIHLEGFCSGVSRGAKMLCLDNSSVLDDLKQSIALLNSKISFCFPFYAYNNNAISIVKEAGFKLAFVAGNYKATRTSDKFKIPRYPIYHNITLEQFKAMVN